MGTQGLRFNKCVIFTAIATSKTFLNETGFFFFYVQECVVMKNAMITSMVCATANKLPAVSPTVTFDCQGKCQYHDRRE